MNAFEILEEVEHRRLLLCYSLRHRSLMVHDYAAFPAELRDAIRARSTEVARLVSRYGVRLGYHRIRSSYSREGPWHVVVDRHGYFETLCRVRLADSPIESLARSLPRPDPERRNLLCQRCVSRHIARELERVADLSPGRNARGGLPR